MFRKAGNAQSCENKMLKKQEMRLLISFLCFSSFLWKKKTWSHFMKHTNEIKLLDSNYSCCIFLSLPLGLQPGRKKALAFVLSTEAIQYVFQTERIHELENTFSNNTMPYRGQLKQLQEFYLHKTSALIKINSVNSHFNPKNYFETGRTAME